MENEFRPKMEMIARLRLSFNAFNNDSATVDSDCFRCVEDAQFELFNLMQWRMTFFSFENCSEYCTSATNLDRFFKLLEFKSGQKWNELKSRSHVNAHCEFKPMKLKWTRLSCTRCRQRRQRNSTATAVSTTLNSLVLWGQDKYEYSRFLNEFKRYYD